MENLYPRIFKTSSQLEIETIEKMLEQIKIQNLNEEEKLKKLYEGVKSEKFFSNHDYETYLDSLSDNKYILDEVYSLSLLLSIVALYRIIEKSTKSILKIYSKKSGVKINIRDVSYYEKLQVIFKKILVLI